MGVTHKRTHYPHITPQIYTWMVEHYRNKINISIKNRKLKCIVLCKPWEKI